MFQRYGYDGFVQLHHHCKVSKYAYTFFFFTHLQKGHRYNSSYATALRTILGTRQFLLRPNAPPPCGPVRLVSCNVSSCRTQHGATASAERFTSNAAAAAQENTEQSGNCEAGVTSPRSSGESAVCCHRVVDFWHVRTPKQVTHNLHEL